MVNDGEESKRFQQLTLDCVSEESSPDESGSMRVHRPVWCSSSKYSCLSFWCMLSHNWFVAWKRKPGMIHHNIHYTTELNTFLQKLEKRIDAVQQDTKKRLAERKRRIESSPLHSVSPPASARWTVDKEWLKGNHSTTSILINSSIMYHSTVFTLNKAPLQ